jgi:hypothetical protein
MKNIELLEKVDHIKSNWFEWAALRNEPDGSQTEGTVQADGSGDMIAEESFTPNASS